MLQAMSFLDRLRRMFAGPPRVQAGDDAEAAALREEFGAAGEGTEDLRRVGGPFGGGAGGGGAGQANIGYGTSEAAETVEGDLSTEEPPSDPTS
jgi:hypothetical protein